MKLNYTEISKTYDNYRSYPKSLIKKIIEFGKINEGMKILDLGCGTGNGAFQLLGQINVDIIGVDRSLSMLKIAKEKSLMGICADVDNSQLPFHNSSFDAVIGAYIIHQLNNLRFIFSECYRILRDGVLVLLTSSHKQIEYLHPVIKQFFPSYIDIEKDRFPDIPKIEYLLNSVGFSGIRHQEILVEDIPLDQEYLQRVKNKYISTYYLLPQREFEVGIEKLEAFIKNRGQPESREWRSKLVYGRKNG